MTRPPALRGRGLEERGTAAVELLVLAVVFLAFAAVVVLAGRMNVAYQRAEGAARSAARTLTVERGTPGPAAIARAQSSAAEMVGAGTSMCTTMEFPEPEIHTIEGSDPPRLTVNVQVRCSVDLSQTFLLDLPGSLPARGEASEVIDAYREDGS